MTGAKVAAARAKASRNGFPVDGPDAVLSVEFAAPGTRARKVKTRSKARASGAYPSFRMRRTLHWESDGERDAFRLLDADPSVLFFTEQPCVILYRLRGALHRHFPDLLVKRRTLDSLVEVKPRAEACRDEVAARTALLCVGLPHFGFAYEVLISEELCVEPRLTNVNFVLRQGRADINLIEREELRRYLQVRKSIGWSDIAEGRAGALTLAKACRLILEGELAIDFQKSWKPDIAVNVIRAAGIGGNR